MYNIGKTMDHISNFYAKQSLKQFTERNNKIRIRSNNPKKRLNDKLLELEQTDPIIDIK